ncbi:MAG TPA: 50S ribosomal protein L34e [Candidatus Nanoarchaeia archaeon]|nr:50S ribosomal protein L34e [Candidatus Nanoarchaeia archaeon]
MPAGKHKSGRYRKVFVRTPGGNTTIHYRKRKPKKAICANCKKQLAGVPRELPSKMANMPKTAKRPERPYGGVLCSGCTRELLKQKARGEQW